MYTHTHMGHLNQLIAALQLHGREEGAPLKLLRVIIIIIIIIIIIMFINKITIINNNNNNNIFITNSIYSE